MEWRRSRLPGLPVALDLFGEAPAVHLRGAVIDSKGTRFAEYLFDDGVLRDARATHHLDTSIGDPEEGLGHRDLRHRPFRSPEEAGVQHRRTPVDHEFGLLQFDQI